MNQHIHQLLFFYSFIPFNLTELYSDQLIITYFELVILMYIIPLLCNLLFLSTDPQELPEIAMSYNVFERPTCCPFIWLLGKSMCAGSTPKPVPFSTNGHAVLYVVGVSSELRLLQITSTLVVIYGFLAFQIYLHSFKESLPSL